MPNNNPKGKGGFGERPKDINRNGRRPEPSITRIIKDRLQEKVKKRKIDSIIGRDIIKRAMEVLDRPACRWTAAESKLVTEVWHMIDGMPMHRIEQKNEFPDVIPIVNLNASDQKILASELGVLFGNKNKGE